MLNIDYLEIRINIVNIEKGMSKRCSKCILVHDKSCSEVLKSYNTKHCPLKCHRLFTYDKFIGYLK